jgi:hypothetical protein
LGAATFTLGPSSENVLSGYQSSWINTTSGLIGFGPADAKYALAHDPTHALTDPSGWTLIEIPTGFPSGVNHMGVNNFGGPYDPVNHVLYPSTFALVGAQAFQFVQLTGL